MENTMKKKDNQNIYHISFPDWYSDPRDFHEAVIKTWIESRKLKLSDSWKKPRKSKQNLGQFLYLPIKAGMTGVWYATICSGYILNGYKKVIILFADEKSKKIMWIKEGLISHEFDTIAVTSSLELPRYPRQSIAELNQRNAYLLSILPCLTKLESIDIIGLGLNWHDNAINEAFFTYFDGTIGNDTCVIVCADFEKELDYPIMGAYFESITYMYKRKSKAVQFSTDFGDMMLQVA